jgi:WD40 repeat protein
MRDKPKFSNLIIIVSLGMIFTACKSTARTSMPITTINSMEIPTPLSPTLALLRVNTPSVTMPPLVTPLPTGGNLPPTVACFITYNDPFAFIPKSFRMLVRGSNGVQIFNLQTMREEKFINAPSNLNDPVVALAPDGQTLAWALADGTIQRISISDQTVLYSVSSGQTSPIKLEFAASDDRLYSTSHNGSVKVWDKAGNSVSTFQSGGELMNIGISPDGRILATIPFDGPVSLWSTEDFHQIKELGGTGGYDTSDIAFSPDGQFLAADLATSLYLWNISDGAELLSGNPPFNSMAVTFSPDGKTLAYGDLNTIVLRSPDGSEVIRTLEGHQSPIYEVLFSPDSSILVSADGVEVRVWQVEAGQLLAVGKPACP